MCQTYQDADNYNVCCHGVIGDSQNVRDDWEGREQVETHGSDAFQGFSQKDDKKHVQTRVEETTKTRQEHDEVEDIVEEDTHTSHSTTFVSRVCIFYEVL